MPLDEIPSAESNPRRHKIDLIRKSLARFGYTAPALLDERTGRLVAGHGRLQAVRDMRAAGEKPPFGIRVAANGDWLAPVARGWASLNDAEAAAYLVADNRHVELGGWDGTELADLLKAVDTDLAGAAGFTGDDLAGMMAAFDAPVALPPSMFSSPAAPPAPLRPAAPAGLPQFAPPGAPLMQTAAPPPGGWPSPNAWPPQPAHGYTDTEDEDDGEVVVHGSVPATGAQYAETPEQEAARAAKLAAHATRETANTAEMTLVFPKDDRDEAVRLASAARDVLGGDLPNSEVVLRALRVLVAVLDARHDFEPVPVSFFAKLVGAADL